MAGRVLRALKANAADLFAAGDEGVPVLTGVRAVACVWVVAYHVLCIIPTFMTADQWVPLRDHWSLTVFRMGNSAPDVFFVLTGFLLAYPMCVREFKLNAQRSPTGSATGAGAPYDTSAFDSVEPFGWWYRRFVVRIWPPLLVALALFCLVLFPGGKMSFRFDQMPESVWPPTPDPLVPNMCGGWWKNALWVNNYDVLGSCMPWTWSLSVQAHWYAAFPLLVRVTRRARNLALVSACTIALSVAWRYHSVVHALDGAAVFPNRMPVPNNVESVVYALWFMALVAPTGLRLSAFAIGALAAYVQARVHTSPPAAPAAAAAAAGAASQPQSQQSQCVAMVQRASAWPSAVHAVVFGVLVLRGVVQNNGGDAYGVRGVDAPWHFALEYLGGPLWSCAIAYVMLIAANRVSLLGRVLHRALTWRALVPVAKTSYAVYLTHFGLIQLSLTTWLWPLQPTMAFVWFALALHLALAFALGALLYVCVEKPLADALARVDLRRCCCHVVAASVHGRDASLKRD